MEQEPVTSKLVKHYFSSCFVYTFCSIDIFVVVKYWSNNIIYFSFFVISYSRDNGLVKYLKCGIYYIVCVVCTYL